MASRSSSVSGCIKLCTPHRKAPSLCYSIICLHFLLILSDFNVQAHVNEIDFDYAEYARQRFQQYWMRKPELLSHAEAVTSSSVGEDTEDY